MADARNHLAEALGLAVVALDSVRFIFPSESVSNPRALPDKAAARRLALYTEERS
jgi:hypothetical protein